VNYNAFFSVVQTIFVLIAVIALANITLKYVNKHMNKQNKMIKVHERVSVSNNSSLNIVEICGSYYLMSFTGSENKILKELNKEDVLEIIEEKKINQEQIVHMALKMENKMQIKNKLHSAFRARK
jgi:flagellar biogenesis protein FliO